MDAPIRVDLNRRVVNIRSLIEDPFLFKISEKKTDCRIFYFLRNS